MHAPWRRPLLRALEEVVEGLGPSCRCSAESLQAALQTAALALARGALCNDRSLEAVLVAHGERLCFSHLWQWCERGDSGWLPEVDPRAARVLRGASSQPQPALHAFVRGFRAHAADGAVGWVEQLGELHQLLLATSARQLRFSARRGRLSGRWIEAEPILAAQPEQRGKLAADELQLGGRTARELAQSLSKARSLLEVWAALLPHCQAGDAARGAGCWVLEPGVARRRGGAHYTPWALCEQVVAAALGPLVERLPRPRSEHLLQLRLCDPAMGAGAMLVSACLFLARELQQAQREERSGASDPTERACALVCRSVLFGVDEDPLAVAVAQLCLQRCCGPATDIASGIRERLRHGNSVVGRGPHSDAAEADLRAQLAERARGPAFDWLAHFSEIFSRQPGGFDAVIGNPPWVAFVGRAAQPLDRELATYYAATSPSFRRYRTLHGVFVHRGATLLRPGGRLGFVLPTSVADLDGYGPTRAAHDRLCAVDPELPDWGDGAFEGVFQPSMALLSTRCSAPAPGGAATWPLRSPAASRLEEALLERLRALPRCPPDLFGERGYQTTRGDQGALLTAGGSPPSPHHQALFEGADISEFERRPNRLFVAASELSGRLRPTSQWQEVAVWIRQTARFPIAARSSGEAFRNSILAGFARGGYPADLTVAYLNSALARWWHFSSHRDARQGMPQLKIGHLRRLPAFPEGPHAAGLCALSRRLSARNRGLGADDRAALDGFVFDAFGLSEPERRSIERWAAEHPVPRARPAKAPIPKTAGAPRPPRARAASERPV